MADTRKPSAQSRTKPATAKGKTKGRGGKGGRGLMDLLPLLAGPGGAMGGNVLADLFKQVSGRSGRSRPSTGPSGQKLYYSDAPRARQQFQEDDPRFDWRTMGNQRAGGTMPINEFAPAAYNALFSYDDRTAQQPAAARPQAQQQPDFGGFAPQFRKEPALRQRVIKEQFNDEERGQMGLPY